MNAESQGYSTSIKSELVEVKKEQLDLPSHGQSDSLKIQQQQKTSELSPMLINDSYSEDLQDIFKANKLNNIAHHIPGVKHEKIRLMIEDSIREESRSRVQEIFSQVEQLKLEEKLLLYLKLPVSLTNTNGMIDPLKQPLNPLGNRYEIHQTIMWIKTHLEEDPEVSLPKQEVYDEYNIFCSKNSMKPLSTADFGKVMKQVYPRVRPRRLGTRGNSRYCYAGMRKRIKLDPPTLPSITDTELIEDAEHNVTEEMLGAASTLIREWAETLLDVKFPTLCALGKYLVNNLCVDSRSLAAVCILSASGEPQVVKNKVTNSGLQVIPVSEKTIKLKEAQLQLQRKLQQREQMQNYKHELLEKNVQNENKEKIIDSNNENHEGGGKKNKKSKININHLAQSLNTLKKMNVTDIISTNRQKKIFKSNNQSCSVSLQSNCDNLVIKSIQDKQSCSFPWLIKNEIEILPNKNKLKNTRKRSNLNTITQVCESSDEKQLKCLEKNVTSESRFSSASIQQSAKISVILANNLKSANKSTEIINETTSCIIDQPFVNCNKESLHDSKNYSKSNKCFNESDLTKKTKTFIRDKNRKLEDNSRVAIKDKIDSIDSDALNDYLNGGNNSQEQEEELLQYFQQSNSSSSDIELGSVIGDAEQISRQDKVSQLRIILQENLKDSVLTGNKVTLQSKSTVKQQILQKHNLILPTPLSNSLLNPRRRVSFETSIVEQNQENDNGNGVSSNNKHFNNGITNFNNNTILQSPNTRRRIFNFTPISPGPHSPINSKSNSANASPFVSPRNTPVPRSRSNLQGSCRSRSSRKILSRSISCNVAYSSNKNETFIVPNSAPDTSRQINSSLTSNNNKVSQVPQLLQLVHSFQDFPQKMEGLVCDAPILTDVTSQENQLLINYPSQENLQEIKNIYQKHQPTDQEIANLLQSEKQQFAKEQLFCRSQSVPLHRMVNPALLSPILTHQLTTNFLSHSFNPSTSSSIAPTPVPSEFNDFESLGSCNGSNYLLNIDPLIPSDQHFLIEDKEIIPENLNNIFDILNEREEQILTENTIHKDDVIDSNTIVMHPLSSSSLNNSIVDSSNALLDNWTNETSLINGNVPNDSINNTSKMTHSRSYPNTPLPLQNHLLSIHYPEDSNASRSYPTTPLHNLQLQEIYTENNEPMLFNSALNTLNLDTQSTNVTTICSTNVECNVADFLEPNISNDHNDDFNSLGNFDGLQDVSTLSPLFTEVAGSNH